MTQDRLNSVHAFYQEFSYSNASHNTPEVATVYLTINHQEKTYTIDTDRPIVGYQDIDRMRRDAFRPIDELAFVFKDISEFQFARYFATLSAIYKAMIYACTELAIARPTQITDMTKMFHIDCETQQL